MSFVDYYLPYFRQQVVTHPLSALLPFQPLFTENSCRDQPFAYAPFSGAVPAIPSLCCVSVFSSSFVVQFFVVVVVLQTWGLLVFPGGYAGLSQGWLREYYMMLGAHLLVCLMSPKQVWSQCLVV
jgi:hypothetical protein